MALAASTIKSSYGMHYCMGRRLEPSKRDRMEHTLEIQFFPLLVLRSSSVLVKPSSTSQLNRRFGKLDASFYE